MVLFAAFRLNGSRRVSLKVAGWAANQKPGPAEAVNVPWVELPKRALSQGITPMNGDTLSSFVTLAARA